MNVDLVVRLEALRPKQRCDSVAQSKKLESVGASIPHMNMLEPLDRLRNLPATLIFALASWATIALSVQNGIRDESAWLAIGAAALLSVMAVLRAVWSNSDKFSVSVDGGATSGRSRIALSPENQTLQIERVLSEATDLLVVDDYWLRSNLRRTLVDSLARRGVRIRILFPKISGPESRRAFLEQFEAWALHRNTKVVRRFGSERQRVGY